VVTLVAVTPAPPASADELVEELRALPYKIVYETHRDGNWELFMVGADGSGPVNLTNTPEVNEICPHVSPDGTRVTFLVDRGRGESLERSAWCMNLDGTDRRLIGRKIRWSCWSPDGERVAYTKQEEESFSYSDGTTVGLFFYDTSRGSHQQHPNGEIYHIYNLCWSPDARWLMATVHAGMGYRHTNLAIEADGNGVFDLGLRGCRPDVSPDGKRIAWGETDWTLRVADLDLSGPVPKVSGIRSLVTSEKPVMVYHVDWSPDGKYVAFSRGTHQRRLGRSPAYLGIPGEGWDLCVADAAQTNRWVAITSDGKSNKEPDWVSQGEE
jgi:Tol biopolymer transport system component